MILSTATDKPWSDYFCCVVFGNRDFVRAHPVATKRYLRALLKATDLCAIEPERAAQGLIDAGFTPRYDYALQTLIEFRTTAGASSMPRTRCASSRCACMRSA